jgi:flagellar motor switch protein FliM
MDCSYGVLNGQYALKVEKLLATNEQQTGNPGEHHV